MSTNGVPEVLKSRGVSAETVKALSAFKDEPGWLTEKRLSAWRTFEKTPMPSLRDEAWRYTDIADVRIEDFLPYAPSPDVTSEADLPDAVQRLIHEGEENSALLAQQRRGWPLRSGRRLGDARTVLRRPEPGPRPPHAAGPSRAQRPLRPAIQ